MSTINISIGGDMAASQALVRFDERCDRLNIADRQQITQAVTCLAKDLEHRGKELSAMGIQFSTTKVLDFHDCRVRVTAAYGGPRRRSFFGWLRSCLPLDSNNS